MIYINWCITVVIHQLVYYLIRLKRVIGHTLYSVWCITYIIRLQYPPLSCQCCTWNVALKIHLKQSIYLSATLTLSYLFYFTNILLICNEKLNQGDFKAYYCLTSIVRAACSSANCPPVQPSPTKLTWDLWLIVFQGSVTLKFSVILELALWPGALAFVVPLSAWASQKSMTDAYLSSLIPRCVNLFNSLPLDIRLGLLPK